MTSPNIRRSSASAGPPVLPNDLQREILEISALSQPKSIAKLMRTSVAVKEWVEPLLYRAIAVELPPVMQGDIPIFTWSALVSAIHSKPASFFHHAVRYLAVLITDGRMVDLQLVLSVCTNLQHLALFPAYMQSIDEKILFLSIAPLPLTRLVTHLIDKMIYHLGPTHVAFTRLTHLELRMWTDSTPLVDVPLLCENIAQMPQLTHLSFADTTFLPLCRRVLDTCPALRVLVSFGILMMPINTPDHDYNEVLEDLAHDKRFVAMIEDEPGIGDWISGARGQEDYWERAEQFIAQRELGEGRW
ncbi:hypothetical protein C8R46DRAFT_604575 [Mycena filopes]|nr:hypothetical protein C8R46DRAFT_604575 [Mycena filopes]